MLELLRPWRPTFDDPTREMLDEAMRLKHLMPTDMAEIAFLPADELMKRPSGQKLTLVMLSTQGAPVQ